MKSMMPYDSKEQIAKQTNKALASVIPKAVGKESSFREPISDFYLKDLLGYLNSLFDINNSTKDEQKTFNALTDGIVLMGDKLEQKINFSALMKTIKNDFRLLVGPWAYSSKIVKRAFEKPRGYPGDYELLEIIYDNAPITEKSSRMGYLFDQYFLNDDLAIAVRERKDKMSELLLEYIGSNDGKPLNITNFASGSMRDVRELLPKIRSGQNIKFNCVDFDQESLDFSKTQLRDQAKFDFAFLKEDIISISLKKKQVEPLLNQDLVYSIGLIDYLPDRVLQSFINYGYNILKSDGHLVLSHKDQDEYVPLVQDWFCDWTFYQRSRQEVVDIIASAGVPKHIIKIIPLDVKSIYYIVINRSQSS